MDYKVKTYVTHETWGDVLKNEIDNAPLHYKGARNNVKYFDYLLIFEVGDFYETYCDDAYKLSNACGVLVTNGDECRIAGFPKCKLMTMLTKLLEKDYKVIVFDK